MPHLEVCNCASCFFIRQNEYEQREFIHVQKEKLKTFLLTYSYCYWLVITLSFILAKVYFHISTTIILSLFGFYITGILLFVILSNYAFAISYLGYLLKPKDAISHILAISLVYSFFISLPFPKFDLYGFFLCIFILFGLHLACFCMGYIVRVAKNRQLNPIS
ncbi:MAG: hypothetical protein IPK14_18890 [Blastocatellia bacterium]|nr:hypothetical protein [Blastocatellia bacterium]